MKSLSDPSCCNTAEHCISSVRALPLQYARDSRELCVWCRVKVVAENLHSYAVPLILAPVILTSDPRSKRRPRAYCPRPTNGVTVSYPGSDRARADRESPRRDRSRRNDRECHRHRTIRDSCAASERSDKPPRRRRLDALDVASNDASTWRTRATPKQQAPRQQVLSWCS